MANISEQRHTSTILLRDRKSTRLNSSHGYISYAVFCLKKKIARDGRSLTIGIIYKSAFTQRSTPAPATIGFWDDDRVVGTDGWAKRQDGDFLRDATGRM